MTVFERIWQGGADDDGSVHVLGNGQFCAYGQGPNVIQLVGPPYSGPQSACDSAASAAQQEE